MGTCFGFLNLFAPQIRLFAVGCTAFPLDFPKDLYAAATAPAVDPVPSEAITVSSSNGLDCWL